MDNIRNGVRPFNRKLCRAFFRIQLFFYMVLSSDSGNMTTWLYIYKNSVNSRRKMLYDIKVLACIIHLL